MTSEVCIMNRLAVVLAADSATTVTYWTENGKEERYFKGANKIFQLSDFAPVGIMIFDSADILRVPWEVVIKSFRQNLGTKTFNNIAGYANEFFTFIETNTRIFPKEIQHEAFINAARSAALQTAVEATRQEPADKHTELLDAAVQLRRAEVDAIDLMECIGAELPAEISTNVREELGKAIGEWLDELNIGRPSDMDAMADLGTMEVFKDPKEHMNTCGLVFAGFGDHDIFPTMTEYTSCGLLGGKHVQSLTSTMAIDHDTPAWLSAFAQTSMSDTFAAGVSLDIYGSLMGAVAEGIAAFADELAKAANIDLQAIPAIDDLKTQARRSIGSSVLDRARNEHAIPMRRVLGALPVDELAELAETLINLQSLKEKVTKPSESVGGPVDVAVITRNEGLVWIKRKHYFDPAINSRYMQRQMSIHK
ncbi:hypothetical protein [Mesorhizobium sp. LjNodule214]|uniref:hypothetical protein n=1 Tax=Mesorhizobium sp. LjNodule214 TaxID=3342252 RepID=UPI003ECE00B6